MRKIGIFILLLLFVAAGLVYHVYYQITKNAKDSIPVYQQIISFPTYPQLNLSGKNSEEIDKIKHGELLVQAGDCITCHTNTLNNGKPFVGGLPVVTPYGVIYTPNITPDKKTGIGNWSDSDFIKAMTKGIAPDGSYYYPAFPYPYFNKVSGKDLLAIKAYLNAIPAIEQQNLKNNMIWPFGWRFIQLGWRLLFFKDNGAYVANSEQSANWNRGAYLVEGLGHCGMCHTPSYYLFNKELLLAAPMSQYHLAGAMAQGYLAPDITESALDGVPDNRLLKTFRDDRLLGGGELHGPMVEAVHNSLSYLPKSDLIGIIEYLKSVHSATTPTPVLKMTSQGRTIYKLHCSVCHDLGANGAPKLGDYMNWNPLIKSGIKRLYQVAIMGNASMPAKGGCSNCSENEVKAAVDYMVGCADPKNHQKLQCH